MPATSAFQAGVDTTGTQISYAVEATWSTLPAVQFRALRIMSEGLGGQKTISQPDEIRLDRQASAGVTTAESAGGPISFALSYGTYDDLLGTLLGADWGTALNINTGTLAITAPGTVTHGTGGALASIEVGQWVRLGGFTNPANNVVAQVLTNTGTVLTVATAAPLVTEGAASRTITTNGFLKNGTQVQTLYVQKRFASNLWMRYPGAFVSSATLQATQGQFLQGSIELMAQQEINNTSDASTGAIIAAPTGRVMDPVAGVIGFVANGAVQPRCTAFSIQIQNSGAAMQYALGSAQAQGMMPGVFTASGSATLYFANFDLYTRFKNETQEIIGFSARDAAGATYGISIPAGNLTNPQIKAGGPGQAVMAVFEVRAFPHPTLGHTLRIDRMP
jgi:hypothetical protein